MAITEALKLAKDVMAHLEKYGLDKIQDPEKRETAVRGIFDRVFGEEEKVVGFPHKDRVRLR